MQNETITPKAKRRLTNITFEHEGAHIALVGKHQGGPANGVRTLITKSATQLDRASYFTAFGLTQAAADAYVERLALLSDYAFLSVVESVNAQISVQKAQKYIDVTTAILQKKYGTK
ncbi:hypothetical protein [Pseudomonas gingeri]